MAGLRNQPSGLPGDRASHESTRSRARTRSRPLKPGWHDSVEHLAFHLCRRFRRSAKRHAFFVLDRMEGELLMIEQACRLPASCPCSSPWLSLSTRLCSSQLTTPQPPKAVRSRANRLCCQRFQASRDAREKLDSRHFLRPRRLRGRRRNNAYGATTCHMSLKLSPLRSPCFMSFEKKYSGLPLYAHCGLPSSRFTIV